MGVDEHTEAVDWDSLPLLPGLHPFRCASCKSWVPEHARTQTLVKVTLGGKPYKVRFCAICGKGGTGEAIHRWLDDFYTVPVPDTHQEKIVVHEVSHATPGNPRQCKGCKSMVWDLKHERTGNVALITLALFKDGNIEVDLANGTYRIVPKAERDQKPWLHKNHYADCPAAEQFHRKGKEVLHD